MSIHHTGLRAVARIIELSHCFSKSAGASKSTSRKRPRLDDLPESSTTNLLLRMLGGGATNVASAADIARAAEADGLERAALQCLARCGAGGSCASNQERDMHRWLRGMRGLQLEPYKIQTMLQVIWLSSFLLLWCPN